jgi:hypothetical protein
MTYNSIHVNAEGRRRLYFTSSSATIVGGFPADFFLISMLKKTMHTLFVSPNIGPFL